MAKLTKIKGRPSCCNTDPGSGACKKRKKKALQKNIGACINCKARGA